MKRQKRLWDGGVSSAENDAWLRDWSENVRTNKTLETCAGFRERKLRPFLLKEMDPEGKATSFVNGGKNGADRNRCARTGAECDQEWTLAIQRHLRAAAFAEGPVPLNVQKRRPDDDFREPLARFRGFVL